MPKNKSSTLTKSDTQDVKKKLTNEEVRERLLTLSMSFDPKLWDQAYLEQITEQTGENAGEEAITATMTLGLENDYVLVHTVSKKYYGLVIELRRNLIKDFECKNYAEKALVDMAVSGYMRVIRASESFTRTLDQGSTNNDPNQFMATVSKEIDRAHRHFTTAYQMLMQLKQPPINVNLKAKNAYVAQAQQFNMAKPESNEENISPK